MKTKNYLFMLATLFSAAIGFTACSSEDDLAANEGQERGAVKTEFTISFPQQMGSFTRQSLDVVQGQQPPVFRGLQNIELMPFTVLAENVSATTNLTHLISLGTTFSTQTGFTLSNDALAPTSKSHLYKDIEIEIGTRSFMFYAKARDKEVTTGSANIVNGALTKSGTETVGNTTFSPVPIYESESAPDEANEIAKYLTNIANVTVGEQTTSDAFVHFTDINTGSWNSVKAVAQQVYNSLYTKTDALSQAIIAALLKQDWGTATSPQWKIFAKEVKDANNKLTGKLDFDNIDLTDYPEADYPNRVHKTFTYPQNINLPDGAAYVKWDSSAKEFKVDTQNNMGINVTPMKKYAYPASLYYYGLSNIKTVDVSMEDFYDETKQGDTKLDWKGILAKYDAAKGINNVVGANTRSIAIVKEMQYAVGRLDVIVKSKNGAATLKDYKDLDVSFSATDFPITGIIVANQRSVDYKFETKGTDQYVIYDSNVKDIAGTPNAYLYPGTGTPANTYTLVLQTKVAESADDEDAQVPIAVEFLNSTDKTFIGKDGQFIYPGTKFYLIGTLKPFLNTDHYFTGTTNLIKQAFVQDYVTTANFVVESFKKAYNLLPDLRTTRYELGMSVDLTWKPGITQDIIIE